jgi:hypothetical protein
VARAAASTMLICKKLEIALDSFNQSVLAGWEQAVGISLLVAFVLTFGTACVGCFCCQTQRLILPSLLSLPIYLYCSSPMHHLFDDTSVYFLLSSVMGVFGMTCLCRCLLRPASPPKSASERGGAF